MNYLPRVPRSDANTEIDPLTTARKALAGADGGTGVISIAPGLFEFAGAGVQTFLQDLESVASVEVGPITIDPQYGQRNMEKRIEINFKTGEVRRISRNFNPCCQQIAASLISRQEYIRDAVLAAAKNSN